VRDGDPLAVAARCARPVRGQGAVDPGTVIETTARQSFIGTPRTVAEALDTFVQQEAADGFILIPHSRRAAWTTSSTGSYRSSRRRGVFRTEYAGTTLRSHLGLPTPLERLISMTTDISSTSTTSVAEEWTRWHEQRIFAVSAPYGPLSLTGPTGSRLPDGRLPPCRGCGAADGDEVVLTAEAGDGLTADGEPLTARSG